MKTIFISYRRIDSYETNRLVASLKSEYGGDNIFLDHLSITPGDEWPLSLHNALGSASVLVVMIGKTWLFMQDEDSGKRRIDLEKDWVRREIITFLQRRKADPGLLVLPVLVNGATMPNPDFLDPELRALCDFQAISLPNTMQQQDFFKIKEELVKAKVYTNPPEPVVTPVGEVPPDPLITAEEAAFVQAYPGWQVTEHDKPGSSHDKMRELYRRYEFKTYEQAWKFMSVIDVRGIKPNNHHPRWQNTYHRVEVWLCTFNIGHKPSLRDIRLATIMEETWREFEQGLHATGPGKRRR